MTLLVYAFIMFLAETATKGRSLGKLITGTKVVKTDGSKLTMLELLKRNFIRAVPFDQLSFIGSKGWHDNFSDTAVVRIRSFEKEKSLENELELIGVKENL
ncbi:RDD family protein [Kaistella jeonii]|nr:RDD family protein [Kaistella jeonii]VEI96972.1 RDD family [Kaistella jeonii]